MVGFLRLDCSLPRCHPSAMSWLEDFALFHEAEVVLAKSYPHWTSLIAPGIHPYQAFEWLDRSTEDQVLCAIALFEERQEWREVTPESGAMLRLRCSSAAALASALKFASQPVPQAAPASRPLPARIHWYLVEWWDAYGSAEIAGLLEYLPPNDSSGTPNAGPDDRRN